MKGYAIIIFLIHLFPLSIFSQETWPQIRSIEGYTVCVISIDQVYQLNNTYDRKHQYKELSDSLFALVDSCDVLQNKKDALIVSQKKEILYKDRIISDQSEVISNDSTLYSRIINRNKILKFQRGALGIISIVLIVLYAIK